MVGKHKTSMVVLAVFVLAASISLYPLYGHSGWPANHELFRFAALTQVYAEHFSRGDLLPIWSSYDSFGHGSPVLFYYHKTFYYIAAPLYMLLGSVKVALVLTLGLLMLVGQAGVYRVLRAKTSPFIAAAMGVLFITSVYSFNDWLIRGAMAEFTFLMILPWFMAGLQKLLTEGVFSWAIGPIWLVLFFSHNVLALVALLPAAYCWASSLYGKKVQRKHIGKRTAISTCALAVILSPWLFVYSKFNENFAVVDGLLSSSIFLPENNLGNPFVKTTEWYGLSPDYTIAAVNHLNMAGLILLSALAALACYQVRTKSERLENLSLIIFYGSLFLLFAGLQTPVAKILWATLPGASYIQFPWRLQTFTTLFLLIAIGLLLKQKWLALKPVSVIAGLALLAFVIESPLLVKQEYARPDGESFPEETFYSDEDFESSLSSEAKEMAVFGFGEYIPRVTIEGSEPVGLALKDVYLKDLLPKGQCSIERQEPLSETKVVTFVADCPRKAQDEPIEQHYSWLSKFTVDGKEVEATVNTTDGRALIDLPAGRSTIVSSQPSFWDIFTK